MADVLIENPILNSPFHEPERHFKFTDEGITNEIVEVRRSSSYFISIARPKKKGKQLAFDTEWTQDRIGAAKVKTARTLWVPAVNNYGAIGRWAFLEVPDAYDVLEPIRTFVGLQAAFGR